MSSFRKNVSQPQQKKQYHSQRERSSLKLQFFDDILCLIRFQMRQKSKASSMLQNINSLIDVNPFLPIFPRHLAYNILQDCRAVLVEGQFFILSFAVHLVLVFTKKGKVFVVKNVHRQSNPPNVGGFAGVAITASKLMLRPSESCSSSWEIRDIVVQMISDRCEIDNFDLISKVVGLPTEHVIHLDISVGYFIVMQILYSLTDFQKYNTGNISNIAGSIFLRDVADYLRVSVVSQVELIPIHDLSEVAQLIDADDAIVTVHNLIALCDVLVLEPFKDVEFVVEDIQTVCELSICCKESMLFEANDRAQLQGEFSFR